MLGRARVRKESLGHRFHRFVASAWSLRSHAEVVVEGDNQRSRQRQEHGQTRTTRSTRHEYARGENARGSTASDLRAAPRVGDSRHAGCAQRRGRLVDMGALSEGRHRKQSPRPSPHWSSWDHRSQRVARGHGVHNRGSARPLRTTPPRSVDAHPCRSNCAAHRGMVGAHMCQQPSMARKDIATRRTVLAGSSPVGASLRSQAWNRSPQPNAPSCYGHSSKWRSPGPRSTKIPNATTAPTT